MKVRADSSDLGEGLVAGCHKHELGAKEGREFLDQLKDSHILKNDLTPWVMFS